ncbi:MAG: FAD-dependent protein [Bacteroidota bacterium]
MAQTIDIRILPRELEDVERHKELAATRLDVPVDDISSTRIIKRSIDARGRQPYYQLRLQVLLHAESSPEVPSLFNYAPTVGGQDVLIVGAGPTGYFAALRCLELGLRPVVIDRGKDVRQRRRDLRQIQQFDTVNSNSNYCFGEGGAGTYSDGKLYTRSVKRGNVRKILEILVHHGAKEDILIDAHPHIGSNKLPQIVSAIRDTIEKYGGEVHFGKRVTDFILKDSEFKGVICEDGTIYEADATVLATGHSARDIYQLCDDRDVAVEFKPFAIGARLEHPQPLIDKIQYNQSIREEHLPAASYSLSCQIDERGVFSFCMCPGGLIVPAATSPGELVVNGMSLSRRDSPYANAATVVTIDENPGDDAFGGMRYQQELERQVFNHGDGSQTAPAQRLTDFMKGKLSADLPDTSYIPGVYSAPLHRLLPDWIVSSMRSAVKIFDQRMRGYLTREAQLVGLESRTSSPIRIPRDSVTLMSPSAKGLFPAGEGAGYAGGILSAALDGDRIPDQIATYLQS